ncbi:MAG: hypothetical protein QGI45_00770, partial [Myxococcota bacterium]|nr:hypothetical protein [Myxococcota bacterium]
LSGADAQNTVKNYALQTQTQTLRSNSSKHTINDGVEQSTTPSSGLHSTPAGPTIEPGTSDGINIRNNAASSSQKDSNIQVRDYDQVSDGKLERNMDKLVKERNTDLENLIKGDLDKIESAPPPMPEDLSVRPHTYHMTVNHNTDMLLAKDMIRIGVKEGFQVTVRGNTQNLRESLTEKELEHVTFIDLPGNETPWVEDNGNVSRDGTMGVPPLVSDIDILREAIMDGRKDRSDANVAAGGEELETDYTMQGAVASRREQSAKVAYALSAELDADMSLGYIEGGNVLTGTLPSGEPYAVVGKDSYALSKAVIENDASAISGKAETFSQEQIKLLMAKDLGVDPENLILVEQPGDFHVDMSMCVWTPGTILVNDARAVGEIRFQEAKADLIAELPTLPEDASAEDKAALAQAKKLISENPMGIEKFSKQLRDGSDYMRDLGRLLSYSQGEFNLIKAHTENLAAAEDLAAKQLEAQGLEVIRVPGRFGEFRETANFLNGEGGTNPNGKMFFITQGGNARYKLAFLNALKESGVKMPRIHFLNEEASKKSLSLSGGINCRAKVDSEHSLEQ